MNLNKENFPNSYAVYKALGEAYEAKGEKEKAIENYRRALELKAGLEDVKKKLVVLQASN